MNREGRSSFHRALARLIIIVAVITAASSAYAQQPSSSPRPLSDTLQGEAKLDYEAAKLLYNDKDYAAALLKFSSAYDKSNDPRLLWNMAACEKNNRHYARALRHVRRYAADTSGLVTEQERAEANELTKVMEPFTATLRVTVSEPGAEILVDDEAVGTSPMADAVIVDVGAHKLRARKAGFSDVLVDLPIGNQPLVTVDLALRKIVHEGRLVVKAGANDAITIDNRPIGTGTWSGPLASGGHTVRVSAPNMRPYQAEVLIADDQTRELAITLDPEQQGSRIPAWLWIVGGTVVTSGLVVGGIFLFRPDGSYEGPQGNLASGIVQASRPFPHF